MRGAGGPVQPGAGADSRAPRRCADRAWGKRGQAQPQGSPWIQVKEQVVNQIVEPLKVLREPS